MIPLIFECPRTRRAIDAGIQMDKRTLAAVGTATVALYCPHCRVAHELQIPREAVSEASDPKLLEGSELSKAPALSIAVNALRISWLKQGLDGGKTQVND